MSYEKYDNIDAALAQLQASLDALIKVYPGYADWDTPAKDFLDKAIRAIDAVSGNVGTRTNVS